MYTMYTRVFVLKNASIRIEVIMKKFNNLEVNIKKEVPICFLILHYIEINFTKKAVESILALKDLNDSQIVIVDNASPDGSGKTLKKFYSHKDNIHVLLSPENKGFSEGNNYGFSYIKNNFEVQFIISMNNDVVVIQQDFIKNLFSLYKEQPFWVAGPDIYIQDRDYHASPMRVLNNHFLTGEDTLKDIEEFKQCKDKYEKKFSIYGYKYFIKDCLRENKILHKLFQLKRKVFGYSKKYKIRSDNVLIQGACIIFDKRFCDNNTQLFTPLTFMYSEEEILTLECLKKGWNIVYFPELQVLHYSEACLQFGKGKYKEYCRRKIIKYNKMLEAKWIYYHLLEDSK